MLEKMDVFFNRRVKEYEAHQLNAIEGAQEFYPFTARKLPMEKDAKILDLGCGTGLELNYYFRYNPTATVIGIDLADKMLQVLQQKFADKNLTLIQGSYFAIPFSEREFDAVVSVESLHHFTEEEKIPLYQKIRKALKNTGYFLLTDYFALDSESEKNFQNTLQMYKRVQKMSKGMYHFDIPLTVDHELQILSQAGFREIQVLCQWGATAVIRAKAESSQR